MIEKKIKVPLKDFVSRNKNKEEKWWCNGINLLKLNRKVTWRIIFTSNRSGRGLLGLYRRFVKKMENSTEQQKLSKCHQ